MCTVSTLKGDDDEHFRFANFVQIRFAWILGFI